MSWTDERIDLLQKMWLQGMSASKIANELANGLTRNAVIGKVYRLGLSGRAKGDAPTDGEASPKAMPRSPARTSSHGSGHGSLGHASGPIAHHPVAPVHHASAPIASQGAHYQMSRAQPQPTAHRPSAGPGLISGNTALAAEPMRFEAPLQAPSADVVVPIIEPVTIMELRESMCRWPIGDPTQADFRFCGARKTPGAGPYCGCHSAIAYQPQQDRRRQRPPKIA
ncbi:GcrA family cell cycle regulator [Methylocella silvestris]|uniref:GcrA cell cycle regulator n=1 Tax=Methylocella silvestris TaxID=199596 RepID=A0A2J7TFU8_METSI|nr:GcrA family cell cycle regulator [Methylocella silvestris]PNG25632.1 GcrA cell cycle regulator [Methylocella silvestris]